MSIKKLYRITKTTPLSNSGKEDGDCSDFQAFSNSRLVTDEEKESAVASPKKRQEKIQQNSQRTITANRNKNVEQKI